MNKDAYEKESMRNVFMDIKPYIKFNVFLKRNGINQSSFSKYLKGEQFDYEISIEKLRILYLDIVTTLEILRHKVT